jgi:hypothetical protein
MTDKASWSWDEMIAEFRRLGGVVENLRPGPAGNGGGGPEGDGVGGKAAGPGLFPIDPAKEIRLYVPPKLLVPADEVRLENGRLTLAAETSVEPAVRDFFERFQAHFGFGAGPGARCRHFFDALAALPDAVKTHIKPALPPDLAGFAPADESRLLRRFLRGRAVEFGGKPALAVVAELFNHGADQPFFDMSQGLRHTGKFDGEVLTRYSGGDAWDAFLALGIASLQVPAFALQMEIRTRNGKQIRVGRRFEASEMLDGVLVPRVEQQPEGFTLAHLLLGHRMVPGLPRAAFRRAMRDRDIGDADETFELFGHLNRMWFLELLRLLEGCNGALERTLREAALCQLIALSHAIGTAARGEKRVQPN